MKILTVSLLLLLGGCAQWDAMATGIAQYGAQAADRELDAAVWAMCQAGTRGALQRRFNTDEKMKALNLVCDAAQKQSDVELK